MLFLGVQVLVGVRVQVGAVNEVEAEDAPQALAVGGVALQDGAPAPPVSRALEPLEAT